MFPSDDPSFTEQARKAAGMLAETPGSIVPCNVTEMSHAKVDTLREQFAVAGVSVVLFDDSPNPRPGTLPSTAQDIDDQLYG